MPHEDLGWPVRHHARSVGVQYYALAYARSWGFGFGYVPLSLKVVMALWPQERSETSNG